VIIIKSQFFTANPREIMKILMIYPYFLEDRINVDEISVPPQGIYYVAAACKQQGYDVEVLNWFDGNRTSGQIRQTLAEKQPDVIGFSILHANRWGGIEIAAIAKEIDPGVQIVFGGIGASYLWKHLLAHFTQIDYVVIGEGEYTFIKLIQYLSEGRASDISAIGGIALRQDGRVIHRDCDAQIKDLDNLANPAQFFTYTHVSLTRGCPGGCTFCGSPAFWHRKVRFHSPTYFVDQLEYLSRKGINYFLFSDDTFTVNRNKVLEVCQQIIDRQLQITWQAISRVDMINRDVLFWMRKAGCIQISYGVESGSAKIRRLLNKNFTDGQIERAFRLTTRYGMLSRAYFIYGCPGETEETIQESIALIRRIKPLGTIFYILDLFPGTALYEVYKQATGVTDDIWLNRIEDILYFETDSNLNQEKILEFGRNLRQSFYETLPDSVAAIELEENEELRTHHADFLSRLAMTFDHGEYAGVKRIPNKASIAEGLYRRALAYHADQRAYLGLGILLQKDGRSEDSKKILEEGVRRYPHDGPLHICLGISLMNMERYEDALKQMLPFKKSRQALGYIADCYQALNDYKNAALFRDQIEK
jgi:radical SAM superfamily enzyme YgiQ (UPF0313 family)